VGIVEGLSRPHWRLSHLLPLQCSILCPTS